MQRKVKHPIRCHTANSTTRVEKINILFAQQQQHHQPTNQYYFPHRIYSLFSLINLTFIRQIKIHTFFFTSQTCARVHTLTRHFSGHWMQKRFFVSTIWYTQHLGKNKNCLPMKFQENAIFFSSSSLWRLVHIFDI